MDKIGFVGSIRCSQPLDPTAEKKYQKMKALGELFVVGFSQDLLPRRFTQHAHFYLLPQIPLSILRYIEMFTLTPVLVLWLIVRRQVQIFVVQSPYDGVPAAITASLARVFGRRIVLIVESHGDFEESVFLHRKVAFSALYRVLMTVAARFTIRQADMFRAVSNSTRAQLARWKPDCPIFQFVTWTDIETFQDIGARRNGDFSHTFLYAGDLIPRKGVVHLIKAFAMIIAEFPQSRLFIVGKEVNRTYTEHVKELADTVHPGDAIHFIPGVPQRQLARYMGQADVFVLPTYSEGLPRVVFEAMSAGLPVIATAVSGIPEIVEEGQTGFLIQPGDEAALADKMRWMLEHSKDAQQMGRQAYDFATQRFSSEAYVQAYSNMFHAARQIIQEGQLR